MSATTHATFATVFAERLEAARQAYASELRDSLIAAQLSADLSGHPEACPALFDLYEAYYHRPFAAYEFEEDAAAL